MEISGYKKVGFLSMTREFLYVVCVFLSLVTLGCKERVEPCVFSTTLEGALGGIYSGDLNGVIFHVNDSFLDSSLFYNGLKSLERMEEYKYLSEDISFISNNIKKSAKLDFINDLNVEAQFKLDTIFNDSQTYEGVLVLSEPTFVNDRLAYFYLGLYCRENCYKDTFRNIGNLVRVRMRNGSWEYETAILLWGG